MFQQQLDYCRPCLRPNSKRLVSITSTSVTKLITQCAWKDLDLAGGKWYSTGLETRTAFYKNLSLRMWTEQAEGLGCFSAPHLLKHRLVRFWYFLINEVNLAIFITGFSPARGKTGLCLLCGFRKMTELLHLNYENMETALTVAVERLTILN